MYLAYEEKITGELRINLNTGLPVLENKIIVRYEFDKYVDFWLPVPIVNAAHVLRTKEQGGTGL